MSRLDLTLDPKAAAGRRVEVITGGGGRRRWSEGEKARAVEASLEPGAVVSAVARQHGVTPQQLFSWRREARRKAAAEDVSLADGFVPVVVEASASAGGGFGAAAGPAVAHAPAFDRTRCRGIERFHLVWRGAWHGEDHHRRAEERQVIGPSGALRVMVATRPVDFRKGADGLAALVREIMQANPFDGAIYVFRAKRADRLKLLFWDGTGVCLLAKRLEENDFCWPKIEDGVMRLTSAQLSALLEGLDWKRVRPANDIMAPLLPG